jgi:hypothetical protein
VSNDYLPPPPPPPGGYRWFYQGTACPHCGMPRTVAPAVHSDRTMGLHPDMYDMSTPAGVWVCMGDLVGGEVHEGWIQTGEVLTNRAPLRGAPEGGAP